MPSPSESHGYHHITSPSPSHYITIPIIITWFTIIITWLPSHNITITLHHYHHHHHMVHHHRNHHHHHMTTPSPSHDIMVSLICPVTCRGLARSPCRLSGTPHTPCRNRPIGSRHMNPSSCLCQSILQSLQGQACPPRPPGNLSSAATRL